MRTRHRRLSRSSAGMAALAVIASGSLALALGIGLPDPGAAERAYGALMGLLGCAIAMRWLHALAEGRLPRGRFDVDDEQAADLPPEAPTVSATRSLERALGLGASTIGSYNLLVRPRLQALAFAKLQQGGSGVRRPPVELLGEAWSLLDPATPPPPDRMAPGIALARIEQLVEALERLP